MRTRKRQSGVGIVASEVAPIVVEAALLAFAVRCVGGLLLLLSSLDKFASEDRRWLGKIAAREDAVLASEDTLGMRGTLAMARKAAEGDASAEATVEPPAAASASFQVEVEEALVLLILPAAAMASARGDAKRAAAAAVASLSVVAEKYGARVLRGK